MTSRTLSTFFVDRIMFGIDVDLVAEVRHGNTLTPVPLAHPAVAGLANLRGRIVAAIDLRERLGMAPAEPGARQEMVVVFDGDELTCLIVDAAGDVVDVDAARRECVPETIAQPIRLKSDGAYTVDDTLMFALSLGKILSLSEA